MTRPPRELVNELTTVGRNKVIFFDNNFLANRYVKDNLRELARLKLNGHPIVCESQSGFDGRLLDKDPELAELVRRARFRNVRIAWDNSYREASSIRRQVGYLTRAGYAAKDLSVFILYNYRVTYEECLRKLDACAKLGVQISDCRFRPLAALGDDYRPQGRLVAEPGYYIYAESGWTDQKVHDFRRRVREHSIWIRYAKERGQPYDRRMEHWSAIHNTFKFFHLQRPPRMETIDESVTWRKRVELLTRARSVCEKAGSRPDLGGLSYRAVDSTLHMIMDDGHEPDQMTLLSRAADVGGETHVK